MASRDWAGALQSPTGGSESAPERRCFVRSWLRSAALGGAVLACAAVEASNRLAGIRIHDWPESTRVVVSTEDVASFKVFRLENPHRVVVDLFNTRAAKGLPVPATDSRLVDRIRSSPRFRSNYRIVLDLVQQADHREQVLGPTDEHRHRLVIDLFPVDDGERHGVTEVKPPARDRDVIVAVDPGHGGKDPGTIGAGRVQEKQVVLAIAREMRRAIDAMPGFRTVLIRDGDYFVDLRRRFEIADRAGADMFLSIHANAFRKSSVNGAEVYVLSARGASRETAKFMAERESRPEVVGGFGRVSLHDVDESVARIVVDLSMDSKRDKSVELGEAVLGALAGTVTLRRERLYEKAFLVLRSPSLPSILVETGYLSNPHDRRLLTDPAHQRRIAKAIAGGVRNYAAMHAPEGTLLASMMESGTVRYVVKRGDTLSGIAERYGTSTRLLLARNDIPSRDRILAGRVLLIPVGKASGS